MKALALAEPEGFLRLFLEERAIITEQLPKVRHAAPKFVDQILKEANHPIHERKRAASR